MRGAIVVSRISLKRTLQSIILANGLFSLLAFVNIFVNNIKNAHDKLIANKKFDQQKELSNINFFISIILSIQEEILKNNFNRIAAQEKLLELSLAEDRENIELILKEFHARNNFQKNTQSLQTQNIKNLNIDKMIDTFKSFLINFDRRIKISDERLSNLNDNLHLINHSLIEDFKNIIEELKDNETDKQLDLGGKLLIIASDKILNNLINDIKYIIINNSLNRDDLEVHFKNSIYETLSNEARIDNPSLNSEMLNVINFRSDEIAKDIYSAYSKKLQVVSFHKNLVEKESIQDLIKAELTHNESLNEARDHINHVTNSLTKDYSDVLSNPSNLNIEKLLVDVKDSQDLINNLDTNKLFNLSANEINISTINNLFDDDEILLKEDSSIKSYQDLESFKVNVDNLDIVKHSKEPSEDINLNIVEALSESIVNPPGGIRIDEVSPPIKLDSKSSNLFNSDKLNGSTAKMHAMLGKKPMLNAVTDKINEVNINHNIQPNNIKNNLLSKSNDHTELKKEIKHSDAEESNIPKSPRR